MDYKKALEKAKKWYNYTNSLYVKKILKEIFSEFIESEDERIRKELIDFVNSRLAGFPQCEKFIAWIKKQGEQKHAEYEMPLLEKFKQAVYDCAWGKVTCKVDGESQEEYADRWAEQLLMLVRDWADDYIDSKEDTIARRAYDKGKTDMLKKPNSAWSEEDERSLNTIINTIVIARNNCGEDDEAKDMYNDELRWLKSLKDRCIPQSEQILSEDDKGIIATALSNTYSDDIATKLLDRIESLRPQKQWKPSDMELEVLRLVAEKDGTCLMGLYEQLKELKEE